MKRNILLFLAALALFSACGTPKQAANSDSIHGTIRDENGKPVAGVAVTEGTCVAVSDASGRYSLPYDRASGNFVYISTPSGYLNSSFRGDNCYYKDIEKGRCEYDFTVTKNPVDDSRHRVIAFADPQIQDVDDLVPFDGRVDDIADYLNQTEDGTYGFGICLGDLVGYQHKLYPRITGKFNDTGLGIRYTIGNHDMTNWGRSFETSLREFEKFFGPAYYSFNVGKVHYVMLDDCFYVGRDYFYIGYINERQLDWLAQDLALVPEDYKLVLCMHIPTTLGKEDRDRFRYDIIGDNLCNKPAFYDMLKGHDALILSGHMHTNSNFEISDRLTEHNIGGFCGTWWCGTVCVDGCPPGYKVYNFTGNTCEWFYKSCGFAPEHQARLYLDHKDYPGLAVAHVWDVDSAWSVEYWEDGVKVCDMERFKGNDPVSKAEFSDPSKHKIAWVGYQATGNLFKAPYNPTAQSHELRITDRFGRKYIVR